MSERKLSLFARLSSSKKTLSSENVDEFVLSSPSGLRRSSTGRTLEEQQQLVMEQRRYYFHFPLFSSLTPPPRSS